MTINEKWGKPTIVAPSEKGKYKGKNKAELLKSYNALKARGPHKKGSPEYGRMRELAFAIRAKGGWGKVAEAREVAISELYETVKNALEIAKLLKTEVISDEWVTKKITEASKSLNSIHTFIVFESSVRQLESELLAEARMRKNIR